MNRLEFSIPANSVELAIKEVTGLISLPEIYLKFRRLMANPNSNIEEFCEIVSCDPNLTSTVLKTVNSAFFGFPGQIGSINQAIVMLGLGQLHDMVLAASAMESLDLPNEIMPLKTFWRCSLFTGILARLLAKQLKAQKSDRMFVIGLLHEIGHLVIYSRYPKQARFALESYRDGKQPIHIIEQDLLGLHYGQVGAKLMAQWQLPANFLEITAYQPTPSKAQSYGLETALLHVAHGYAHKNFIGADQGLEQLIDPEAFKSINLLPDQIESSVETALLTCSDLEKAIMK